MYYKYTVYTRWLLLAISICGTQMGHMSNHPPQKPTQCIVDTIESSLGAKAMNIMLLRRAQEARRDTWG